MLSVLGLEEKFVRAAVAADLDNLGLDLVQLAEQIDGPSTGDQDQLHGIAERAEADLLIDLPKLAREVKRSCPARVCGEEENSNHLRPQDGSVRSKQGPSPRSRAKPKTVEIGASHDL